jgi:transposase
VFGAFSPQRTLSRLRFDARIEEAMVPIAAAADRLRGVPGMGKQAAEVIVSELGADMAQFATASHLASWAGLCPGDDESAVKGRGGKTTKGASDCARRWCRRRG